MNATPFAVIASPIIAYIVDIAEVIGPTGSRQSRGRFMATCRETGIEITSVNAEHDICHAMTVQGWPDGPVQFWRGSMPSLSHRSIYRMGRHRIELGDNFPRRVKRKLASPEISTESVAGSSQNRETGLPGRRAA